MVKALALVLSLPLVACVVGDPSTTDPTIMGSGGDMGSGGSGTTTTGISGHITQNTDWTGAVSIIGITTIDAGVTVTVAAGSTLTMKSVAALQIDGILDFQGTSAGKITIKPETLSWNGISINAGGELKFKYVEQTGGNISLSGTAKATIVDSRMSHAAGDFLMASGGTIDMSYSAIGIEANQMPADTTHCDMHFNPGGNVIKFVHSNVSSSAYGLMFFGGNNADFTYNNWFANMTDVDVQQSSPVSGNFSNGWFEKGAPTGTGLTVTSPAPTRLEACNGTNDPTCAGIRP